MRGIHSTPNRPQRSGRRTRVAGDHAGLHLPRRRLWQAVRTSLSEPRTAVQLTAVILGALFAALAAVLYSDASGTWQQAIREESVRSSSIQEQIRAVYGDEAPVAFRVAAADARADALRLVDSTDSTNPLVASERMVAEQSAFALRQSAPPGTLGSGKEYALPDGGFDVPRRIADLARGHPDAPNPDRTAAQGDGQAKLALYIALMTVVVTGAAVAVASIPASPRARRRLQREARKPELLPQPGVADRHYHRRTSFVLLALWAAGVLLPFAQLALSGEEQRSQATAARTAVRLTTETATSLARTSFETTALRDAAMADAASAARELAALDADESSADAERAVARAEASAASRTRDIAVQMSRAPAIDQGANSYMLRALASGPAEWETDRRAQNSEADRADQFGSWANGIVAFIAILAAIGAIIEVFSAHYSNRRPRPYERGI